MPVLAFASSAQFELDERVNAQPLLITNQSISNVGVHDVVYVATANNTVYAIDATTGAVLLSRNFGQPVAGCGPWGASLLGILSTPVIDTQAKVMYLVTETLEDGDIIEAVVDGRAITEPIRIRIRGKSRTRILLRFGSDRSAPNHCSWESRWSAFTWPCFDSLKSPSASTRNTRYTQLTSARSRTSCPHKYQRFAPAEGWESL